MKGNQLHSFLITLNQAEKNRCTRYLMPGGTKRSKYARLYRAMISCVEYHEFEVLRTVYGDEPYTQQRYESTCEYLSELVVSALAEKDPQLTNLIPGIRKAREKGLTRLASKFLTKSFKKALEGEEFEEMLILFQETELLAEQFGVDITLKLNLPNRISIFNSILNLETLSRLMEEFQNQKWKLAEGEQISFLEDLAEQLKKVNAASTREEYHLVQLEMRLALFSQSYFRAVQCQERIIDLVMHSNIPRITDRRILEHTRMISTYHYVGQFESANLELMRLKAAPVRSQHDQTLKLRHSLSAQFVSALTLGEVSLGHSALEEFKSSKDLITQEELGKLHYYAALFLSWTGNWKEARSHIQRIDELPARHRKLFHWQLDLMFCLCYLEEEKPDLAAVCIERLGRKAQNDPYLSLIARGLKRLLYLSSSDNRLLLSNLKQELLEQYQQPKARFQAQFFDLTIWIDAKLKNKTLLEEAKIQYYLPARQVFSKVDLTGYQ